MLKCFILGHIFLATNQAKLFNISTKTCSGLYQTLRVKFFLRKQIMTDSYFLKISNSVVWTIKNILGVSYWGADIIDFGAEIVIHSKFFNKSKKFLLASKASETTLRSHHLVCRSAVFHDMIVIILKITKQWTKLQIWSQGKPRKLCFFILRVTTP